MLPILEKELVYRIISFQKILLAGMHTFFREGFLTTNEVKKKYSAEFLHVDIITTSAKTKHF